MANALAFIVLLLISPAVYAATTHTVGGNSGWNSGVNYDNWAGGQTFTTGDTLVFTYGFTHSVDEVNQADYDSCNTGNPITSYSSSPSRVALTSAGTRYFICPRSNHCSEGMKVTVTTTAASTTPSPPSTTPSPPSTTPSPPSTTPNPPSGTPSTPSGSPGTPSTPTAAGGGTGGAASIMGGGNSLMFGLSVVLAAVFGLMG